MEVQTSVARTVRIHNSILAAPERRLLIAMAERLPRSINSDHLTALGAVALIGVGAAFWAGGRVPAAVLLVLPFLALNWFGDSLDGTLARVRRQERPRYGYYVDHVLDAVGMIWIFGGLILGGFMSPVAGLSYLVAYYLLVVEVSLATHALGTFRISFWKIGPTEMRIALAAGALALLRSPHATVFGHRWLLFDIGGIVAVAGLLATFLVASARNGWALYRQEPV